MSTSGGMKRVVIVRRDLFKPSEHFIYDQAAAHVEWSPVFVGTRVAGPERDVEFVLASNRFRLSTLFDADMPTVVHAHFAIDGILGLALARRMSAPLVTTLHGFDITRSRRSLITSARPNLVRYVAGRSSLQRNGSMFLAVSSFIRDRAIAQGFPADRLRVHHIGGAAGTAREGQPVTREPAGRFDFDVLHVGRLVEKKGTEFLLRALANVPLARLTIVGDGPLRSSLEMLATNLGVAERVSWLGTRAHAEVLDLMRQANVLCVPSVTAANGDSEGLNMVLLEAAAARLPVIATNNGGIADFVRHEHTGLMIKERDVCSLTHAIEQLRTKPELARMLAANAYDLMRESFDVRVQTRKLEAIFDQLGDGASGEQPNEQFNEQCA